MDHVGLCLLVLALVLIYIIGTLVVNRLHAVSQEAVQAIKQLTLSLGRVRRTAIDRWTLYSNLAITSEPTSSWYWCTYCNMQVSPCPHHRY